MLSSTLDYKNAICRPHKRAFFTDLYSGDGAVLARDVPVFGGDIRANLAQRVTRSGAFTVGPEWYSEDPTAPLSPYQTVARIRAGIRYGNGSTETFQIIEGRVGTVTRNADGSVTAAVADRAADVVAAPFEQPRNSDNVSLVAQSERLILEVLPDAVFGPHDVVDALTPKLTWDSSRGDALDQLAGALGARWYQLGTGAFVLRQYPYDTGVVVARIVDKLSDTEGLLFSATASVTRDGAANSVVIIVERADGGAPFRVVARDTSPTSPTQYGDRFGRISKPIKAQSPLTEGQALTMARAELSASTALASQWTVTCQADYTLEPADTVFFSSRGVDSTQLIDSITYPLNDTSPMTMTTRGRVQPLATVQ